MSNEQLSKLEQQKRHLDRKIRQVHDRQKQFAGTFLLRYIDRNSESDFAKQWLQLLDQNVTKTKERELMGLPPTNLQDDNVGAISATNA